MSFLNTPLKSIQAIVSNVIGTATMSWYNPTAFPVGPADPTPTPIPKDFKWRVTMGIDTQTQSSYITRKPGAYNGQDVVVGQWLANLTTGQAWQIITIESKSENSVIAIVQDIYRYNTFRDPSGSGNGAPNTGTYVIFGISDTGITEIDPVPPSGVSSTFGINIQSRFQYINLQYDYPLYQAANTFTVNDVIATDALTNSFVLSNASNQFVIGRVTSISDTTSGWFTINPVQKVVDYLDYLPGDVGDIIYASTTTPGELTLTPGGSQVYINLRANTPSISDSIAPGPTTPSNVFQINGVNITVGGTGTVGDALTATNLQSGLTGISAALVLIPTYIETNNALITGLYGEPVLWAITSPATATINGTLVTFNITSSNPGYTDYARPEEMAQAINNAGIPDIVASAPSALVLRITNTAGGSITIVNGTPDINSVPFAGTASGSGLVLSAPAATTYRLKFTAADARAINFLNVDGDPVADFGLVSVENGIKASGLYIEDGLRTAVTTVVSNLTQLNLLSPLIGDQAYVIDSDDGNGNNVGEWSMWLFDGAIWIQTSNYDSASTDAKSLEYTLTTASPSSINIGSISTGRRVTLITVEVATPFNGTSTLQIGYQVDNPVPPAPVPGGLMSSAIIDLTVSGTYTTTTDILFGTDTVQGDVTITSTFLLGSSTVGEAQIIVSYV